MELLITSFRSGYFREYVGTTTLTMFSMFAEVHSRAYWSAATAAANFPHLWLFAGSVLALAIVAVIVRGFWLYRASLTWPTADGSVTGLDIERRRDGATEGGHYFRATFAYDFCGPDGSRVSGSWYKNFSTESEAHEFAERELPIGKAVVVRFNPRNPAFNDLELDSWTYTNERPAGLNI
jgi:hypothetical protein